LRPTVTIQTDTTDLVNDPGTDANGIDRTMRDCASRLAGNTQRGYILCILARSKPRFSEKRWNRVFANRSDNGLGTTSRFPFLVPESFFRHANRPSANNPAGECIRLFTTMTLTV
jgi:hypothetical protein